MFKKDLSNLFFFLLFLSACSPAKKSTNANTGQTAKKDFHLYLLVGQSNMAGRGKVLAIDTLIHPRVFSLNKEMEWVAAKDPIHFDKSFAGTGLGLTFGKIIANDNPNIKIGLIPCAKGGSSINHWFQDSLHTQTKSYPYNEMVERTKKAMQMGDLKGILWHQGESDTKNSISVKEYEDKFLLFREALCKDLGITEEIPWVVGELGHFLYEKNGLAKQMNEVLNRIAAKSSTTEIVSAENLNHKGDGVHFNTNAYHALGMRYAEKMKILYGK